MAFRHIPHTADVTIEATGETLEEVFSEACRAFTAVLTHESVSDSISHPLAIEAESLSAAFFDFLDALVGLLDADGFLPSSAQLIITHNATVKISGVVRGDSAAHYEHHGDIKAPTYHELTVEQGEHGWLARCTLDV